MNELAFIEQLLNAPAGARPKLLLTVAEAAGLCDMSEKGARNLIDKGQFPTAESPVRPERAGKQIRIPTLKLLKALGLPLPGDQAA